MTRIGLYAALVGFLLAAPATGFTSRVRAIEMPRLALWGVVQTCVAAKQSLDLSLPCLQVDLGNASLGTAVLRSPYSATHILVVPTARLDGIEAPALQKPEASAYWQAALAARRFVTDAAGGGVQVNDVGLAINSVESRTQDQLHIHADCTKPRVLAALREHDAEFQKDWTLLRFWVEGTRFFGTRVTAQELGRINVFERLMRLPGYRKDLSKVAVALFSATSNSSSSDLYVLATWGSGSQTERLLDHTCSMARIRTGKGA